MQMNLKSIWIYLSKLIGLYSTYHLIGHTRCLLNLIAQLKKAFNEMGGRLAEAQFLLNFGHLECFHQGINAWVNALNLTSWTSRRGTPPSPPPPSSITPKSMTRFWTFTLNIKVIPRTCEQKGSGLHTWSYYIMDGHCSSFDDSFLMSYFTTRDVRPPRTHSAKILEKKWKPIRYLSHIFTCRTE